MVFQGDLGRYFAWYLAGILGGIWAVFGWYLGGILGSIWVVFWMVPQLGFRVYRVHEELGFLWGMRGSQLGFRVYRV